MTGEKKKDKAAKVATARTLWVPAVNNHGGFGRWAFIEIADPWDAENTIRGFCTEMQWMVHRYHNAADCNAAQYRNPLDCVYVTLSA